MTAVFPLPRYVFGAGSLRELPAELDLLQVRRPLLLTDAGLVRAGVAAQALALLPAGTACHDAVPENPCCSDADQAFAAYRAAGCDSVVALGGGAVLDTAKFVAALVQAPEGGALALLGQAQRIGPQVAPLLAVPTTIGTGSESSPAAGLHPDRTRRAIGTRSPFLVPRTALCDPLLARSLPRHLVAATGMDALAHCLEGFFAEPAQPLVDAIALEGLALAFTQVRAACEPANDAARAALMQASFAGGVAIHKGLGPAHAVALACGDQHLHHGLLVAAALPFAAGLAARHAPAKAARAAQAMGLASGEDIAPALRALLAALGLPAHLGQAGYRAQALGPLAEAMAASPFNRSAPHAPSLQEYRAIAEALLA